MCIVCTKEYDQNTTVLHCCLKVTEIHVLPNLTQLNCSNTGVTRIPILPNLTYLDCSYTKVTEIPILPNLTYLNCSNSEVTGIPVLPKLIYLNCYLTNVTEIPVLPNLTELYCDHTRVPVLPNLTFLSCGNNTGIYYISHIYKNIRIESNNKIIYYNDYQLRKLQKNFRKRQFLRIIDKLPMHTNISRYLVLPEMLK